MRQSFYRPELDVLRFGAFLMAELLLREHPARGTFDIRAFYIRRILRVWPLYDVALLVLLPLLAIAMPADTMPGNLRISFLVFMGNWACASRPIPWQPRAALRSSMAASPPRARPASFPA